MISVIIATKNGSRYIRRAIESIRTQSEQNAEIVVINDGSTDETASLLSEIQRSDSNLKVLTNEKSVGPGTSRHIGILQATGDHIAFLDDDDRWVSKDKLKLQKEYLNNNPDCVIVGSSWNKFVKEDGTTYPIRRQDQPQTDMEIRKEMLWRNPFITSSVMLRKDAYLKTGGFSNMYLAEDYDLWMQLGEKGTFANIPHCEIEYTVREGNASSTRRQEMNKIVLDLTKKYKKYYPHNYYINLLKAYARVWLFNLKQIF